MPLRVAAAQRWGSIGTYILSRKIFKALDEVQPYACGEIQLTDTIKTIAHHGENVIAYKIRGTRFGVGTPTG